MIVLTRERMTTLIWKAFGCQPALGSSKQPVEVHFRCGSTRAHLRGRGLRPSHEKAEGKPPTRLWEWLRGRITARSLALGEAHGEEQRQVHR